MVGWAEAAPPELGPAPVSVTGSLLSFSGFGTAVCQAIEAVLQIMPHLRWSTLVLSGLISGQVGASSH